VGIEKKVSFHSRGTTQEKRGKKADANDLKKGRSISLGIRRLRSRNLLESGSGRGHRYEVRRREGKKRRGTGGKKREYSAALRRSNGASYRQKSRIARKSLGKKVKEIERAREKGGKPNPTIERRVLLTETQGGLVGPQEKELKK